MFQFEIPSTLPDVILLCITLILTAVVLKYKQKSAGYYLLCCAVYSGTAVVAALELKHSGFDFLRLLCLGVFPGGFALFVILWLFARRNFKILPKLFVLYAVLIMTVAVDAFAIEPKILDITYATIQNKKINTPFRIAVMSDFQTDGVSDYDRKAVLAMLAQKPDLILLPGDYVQLNAAIDWPKRSAVIKDVNQLFRSLKLSAPMGVFAVPGNCEDQYWTQIFRDLPVTCFAKSGTVHEDSHSQKFAVTGLTLVDSFNPYIKIEHTDEFHIVLAHGPDFVMSNPNADLLVCGHTHGGQVQIPFYGPPITMCHLRRDWAQGTIQEIYPGTTLALSRGVGMERELAPRLRFFCHPQILILDMKPALSSGIH